MNHHKKIKINKIIDGCKNNNRKAQKQLYDMYADEFYTICYYILKNKQDAEEALNNAFVAIYDKIRQFEEKGSFKGWLWRIVKNKALEFYRKRKKERKYENKDAQIDNNNFTNPQKDLDNMAYLRSIILQLPMNLRLVFYLKAKSGFSHKEISEILNIREGTSKVRYLRAKEFLFEKLNS